VTDDKVTPWQWAACILIVLAQLLDAGTTVAGLEDGHYEQNPLMAFVLQWGYMPFLTFKLVLAVLLGFLALVSKYIVWVLIAFYAVVIANNISVLMSA
jgi:hypothetical protein